MSTSRSFKRALPGGAFAMAQVSWTRRALELLEWTTDTIGTSDEATFSSESETAAAVEEKVTKLVAAGFVEVAGEDAPIAEPAERAADLVRRKHARPAFVPRPSMLPARPRGSRRGGTPWLATGEPWPACGACDAAMTLVVQIDLATVAIGDLPLPPSGLLQLFVCDTDCYYAGGFEPHATSCLARITSATDGASAPRPSCDADADADEFILDEVTLDWVAVTDTPAPTAIAELVGADVDTAGEAHDLLAADGAWHLEKLGGWPAWIQSTDGVACRACATTMAPVLTLETQLADLRVMSGNVLYVLACPSCGGLSTVQQR